MREPTGRERAVLDALVRVARPIILEEYSADSCIVSTKVAIDALAYFGVPARALPVTAFVFNGEAAAMMAEGATLEELRQATHGRTPDDPEGPWSIGVGVGPHRPGGYAGHLVATVRALRVVVDLSIDQASRPVKGMALESFWTVVDNDGWWQDPPGDPLVQLASKQGATLILDRRVQDATGWRASPNWSEKNRVTGPVIRAMKAALSDA